MPEVPKQTTSSAGWVAFGALFVAAVVGVMVLFWLIVWAMEKIAHFVLGG